MATTASSTPNTDSPNVTRFPSRATYSSSLPKENNPSLSGTNHDHDNNNNYRAQARACAYAREMTRMDDAYLDVLGRAMPAFVKREIEFLMGRGVTPGMVCAVIEYTACAPRPSWAYARTVLYRNMEKGILSEPDFMMSLDQRGRAGGEDLPY